MIWFDMPARKIIMPSREALVQALSECGTEQMTALALGVGRTTLTAWKNQYRVKLCEYRNGHATNTSLTQDDIALIRTLHADGMSKAEISRKFDVVWQTINNVLKGHSWGWVK